MSLLLGRTRNFPQGDGPDVQLKVFGDEFYARYETLDGYTAVYDKLCEKYCYAILIKGHLASSGAPIDKPVPIGLVRHLQEDKSVRNQKFDQKYSLMRPVNEPIPGISATLGENNGLLPGKQLSREPEVRGLTILVNFKNEESQVTADHVFNLLNGDNFNSYGNYCSVKSYYQAMSSGRLEYTNEVVGPVTLSGNKARYIENPLMEEALSLAIDEYNIDLEQFDCTDRGIVDAINFLYAGETLYEGWLWPHNYEMSYTHNGMRTHFYTIQSLGRRPVDMNIGTFCHEAGHLICRFPDLYDYGKRNGDSDPSSGLGYYCLMASGSHLNNGRTPAPVSAYLRNLAGWTGQVHLLNNGGHFNIEHGAYDTLYKYELNNRPNEYFLVENRSRIGMDIYCPANGLAVYHCDTLGSNEWQGGSEEYHYQCALIQADGARHLENNRNDGDAGDLFQNINGIALSHDTVPSSRAWGGVESGLSLYDIGDPGEVMPFRVCNTDEPEGLSGNLTRESRPSMIIPDDVPEGIVDTISINAHGKIKKISLSIDISHTYIGDLEVSLTSPQGSDIVLHNKEGGGADDLRETYDSESILSSLIGEEILGKWLLKVTDRVRQDSGKLRYWKLNIEYETSSLDFFEEKQIDRAIQDNDPSGIKDSIAVVQGGQVKHLGVAFNITHSYHGDLLIRLSAPSGNSVTLVEFNSLGSKSGSLVRKFTDQSMSGLKAFAGEPAAGDWTIHVSDNWLRDEGRLVSWSLTLS